MVPYHCLDFHLSLFSGPGGIWPPVGALRASGGGGSLPNPVSPKADSSSRLILISFGFSNLIFSVVPIKLTKFLLIVVFTDRKVIDPLIQLFLKISMSLPDNNRGISAQGRNYLSSITFLSSYFISSSFKTLLINSASVNIIISHLVLLSLEQI